MRFDDYVGIPWRDHASGRDGCNCWGLVRLIYQVERGIELPAYAEGYANAADRASIAALVAGARSAWDEVDRTTAEAFDLVLMRECGFESHIGIACDRRRMLHVFQGGASMIERMNGLGISEKIAGVFRYRAA